MKHVAGLLSTGAVCAFVLATPAAAQVAGNPGDLHTPTTYTNEFRAGTYSSGPGFAGPFGPVGAIAAPITAPMAVLTGGGARGRCGVVQDFNGRYTASCGL